MRYRILGALTCLVLSTAAFAGPNPDLMVPVQKFLDSFNKGDVEGAAAAHAATADLAIMDEVPPYLWRGPQAVKAWAADLDADAKKKGITDQSVSISAPTREELSGDRAYLVVPAVYSFKERGVAMREAAQMTFALQKGPSGWLIHGWVWTGPKPTPAPKP